MLDAGERLFGERGFRAASMDDIAGASGITKALLYQYFGSKEGLYEACVERARARLFRQLETEASAARPGRARIRAVVTAYFAYLDRERASWWLLYGDASMSAVNEMRRQNAEVVSRLVADDLKTAGGTASRDQIELIGNLIVGSGEQVARWWLEHPELPRRRAIDLFTAATEAAIAGVLRA